jgi:hypothetical protein
MELGIVWWNTGLIPPVQNKQKDQPDPEKSAHVERVLSDIMSSGSVDILSICEISPLCHNFISEFAKNADMEVVFSTEKRGRIIFDTALLYDSTKLEIKGDSEYLIGNTPSNTSLKVGVKHVFKDLMKNEMITVITSHWPSRKNKSGIGRIELGFELRKHIDIILNRESDDSKIIILGDFNDQPYAPSLSLGIRATKDLQLVRKKKKLLYNPFWRHITNQDIEHSYHGSYYHKNGDVDRWYTFDQMIFSSSFASSQKKGWKLDFASSKFHTGDLDSEENKFVFLKHFDHLPIYGVIKYHE